MEHKVEQTLSEIDCLKSKLESFVNQVAGQYEAQEIIAQQTSEKFEAMRGQLANIQRLLSKQVPAAAPNVGRRRR